MIESGTMARLVYRVRSSLTILSDQGSVCLASDGHFSREWWGVFG